MLYRDLLGSLRWASEKQPKLCALYRWGNWPREVKAPTDSLHPRKREKEGSILRFKSRVGRPVATGNRCRKGKKGAIFFSPVKENEHLGEPGAFSDFTDAN